jgi:hypothetical protein
MPTNEERKEVVKALHDLCDGCETVSDYDLAKALCLEAVSRYAYSSESVLRIADLIEPEPERTCNVIFRSHELSQTQTALVKSCSGCGFEFGTEIKNTFPFEVTINSISIPNYCPNCGAKVVYE